MFQKKHSTNIKATLRHTYTWKEKWTEDPVCPLYGSRIDLKYTFHTEKRAETNDLPKSRLTEKLSNICGFHSSNVTICCFSPLHSTINSLSTSNIFSYDTSLLMISPQALGGTCDSHLSQFWDFTHLHTQLIHYSKKRSLDLSVM